MNDNKNTAAQPLDLDKLQRFNNRGGLMNPEAGGLYVRYEELAQARASQPEGATGTTGASVPTWQERIFVAHPRSEEQYWPHDLMCKYMVQEIADLRAQLARKTVELGAAQILINKYRRAVEASIESLKSRDSAPASAQPDRGVAWESDLRKSTDAKRVMMSAFSFCPSDLAHPQKMAWIGDFFIKHYVAAPSPASKPVAPEAIYQVQCPSETGTSIWHDATEDAYHTFMPKHRRIVYTAPTTVPSNSEREAANAGGLPDAEIYTLRRLIECAEKLNERPRPMCRDCADENGTCPNSGLECDMPKLFADAKALHNKLVQGQSPATIAAGQEAANAKDAVNSLHNQMAYIASYDPDELTGGDTKEGMRAASRLRAIIIRARTAIDAAMAAVGAAGQEGGDK